MCLENLNYSTNSTTQTSDFKFWNQVCLSVSIVNPLKLPLVAFLAFKRNLCNFFSFHPALILDKQNYSCQSCSTWSVIMRLAVISSGYDGELHPLYAALWGLKMSSLQAEYLLLMLLKTDWKIRRWWYNTCCVRKVFQIDHRLLGFHQDIGNSYNVLLSSKCGLEVSNSGKDSVCTWCHCLYFNSQV